VALFSKLDLVTLLVDSSFGSGIYTHVFLPTISPRGVNSDLILPTGNTGIFEGDSVDYGTKSICGSEWKSFEDARFEVRSY
jgi:hypothetical protein